MKKFVFFIPVLILFVFFVFCVNTYAKTGDIIGEIYETDITAFINNVEVSSYNIGGKTVIIVEDTTTDCFYNDDLRILIIGGFSPETIKEKKEDEKTKMFLGKKIGNIYETDIKTYFRGMEIPCYALNGKMAVAIEDLGGDNTFLNTGGKFLWNPKKREISLEVIYNNNSDIREILKEKHININIDKYFNVNIESNPIMYGDIYVEAVPTDSLPQKIILNEDTIGYIYHPKNCFVFYKKEDSEIILSQREGEVYYYFYKEKINKVVKNVEAGEATREEWIEHYKEQQMKIIDCIETEKYTFLYMYQPTSHGITHTMKLVYDNGKVKSYDQELETDNIYGIRKYESVEIDKSNLKVKFIYGERTYEINLETGEMEQLK